MKGVVLAGGNGRRLEPITNVTNKHLLAVYDKPMIFYPIRTLIESGIHDILIVSGKEYAGGFLRLLGSGRDFGARFSYEVQDEAGGIAQALGLADDFAGNSNVAVILGDNIFEESFRDAVELMDGQAGVDGKSADSDALPGAMIFLKEVHDPQRFGVAEIDGENVVAIEEKPASPKSNYAVTGLYIYNKDVFSIIKDLKPSTRGELEITDVNNTYIKKGKMKAGFVKGEWTDAGTFESLFRANCIARDIALKKQNV